MDQGYAITSTPTAKRRPLRRDAERNRLLILSAARTVFAQRGLEASLDEVAREAGLGVGTVYRRFPNRDALIDALFADAVDSITRLVDESVAMPRAWDGLRNFMSEMLQLQAMDKGLRDVMLSRKPLNPTEDLLRARIKPPLDDLVRRAQEEGDLRKDLTATDIGVLEVAALGAAEFTAAADPDVWRRFLTIMMDGMRARPVAAGADKDGGAGAAGGTGVGVGAGSNTPLEEPPLDDDQIDACMVGWKYGSQATPHQRARHGCIPNPPSASR